MKAIEINKRIRKRKRVSLKKEKGEMKHERVSYV